MKRKLIYIISVIVVLVICCFIWYKSPVNLTALDPNDISEILIFNGNTGENLSITESEHIEYIINNLNSIKLKRDNFSIGYMGYGFRITISSHENTNAIGCKEFIINSADTVRIDPFFYRVIQGTIDYEYIQSLFNT